MMKTIFIFLFFWVGASSISGQTSIPESGFENWIQQTSYEEPAGNWWTSLNQLKSLGGPVTLTKASDPHSGLFAAKLETLAWGTFILPGLLVSGRFVVTSPFILQGQPFSDKPGAFKGYYKYVSVNSDSAAIFAMLTKYNTISGKRDTIAIAKQAVLTSVAEYTAFDLTFEYTSSETPDSLDVVFSSSAGGANFLGQVGSTLIIDDVLLEYLSGVQETLMPEISVDLFPNPSSDNVRISIDLPQNYSISYTVFSLNGIKMSNGIFVESSTAINTQNYPNGKYILNIYSQENLIGSRKFEIVR
jgi:hypothetical protein